MALKAKRKEVDKIIIASTKEDVKLYKLKLKGGILYKKLGDYFIYLRLNVTGMNNDILRVRGNIKPFVSDDIFWEVFNMQSNIDEPMSLRANGAFKVDGFEAFYEDSEFKSLESLQTLSKELLNKSYKYLEQLVFSFNNYNDFLDFTKTQTKEQLYDYDLVNMLLLIYKKEYTDAKENAVKCMENNKYGRFNNEGKYIYEYIVDYCNKCIERN
ncbi:hypothetical protein [Listeria sp. ILCC792]|uniref:hypothetical protein n=1 Tax=Listeria sp. ILCC792 TaxID=1918331 RepID=UPI002100C532|nr:hypothetical protein [Listeria sp. ILCC792]